MYENPQLVIYKNAMGKFGGDWPSVPSALHFPGFSKQTLKKADQ